MPTDLPTVADELYGLDPADFTATRDERSRDARAAGNDELSRQISALRKPTSAAWAVNLLARSRRGDLQRLFALADQLRSGPGRRDAGELRELNRNAQRVVTAVVRLAGDLADRRGHPLSGSMADQVHQTLRAAMADPDAAAAVLSGRLTTTLEATGLAGLDISAAVAVPTSVTSLTGRSRRHEGRPEPDRTRTQRALAAARKAAQQAGQEAEQAADDARRAAEELDELQRETEELDGEIADARRALRQQEHRLTRLHDRVADADRTSRRLAAHARAAEQRAADAHDTVSALADTGDPTDR